MKTKPIALTVVSGTSVTITIPEVFLKDGCFLNLEFCLAKPDLVKYKDLIIGNEVVLIQNGIGGTSYVVEDKKADIFYADSLILGYCYRLVWGNNGPATTDGATGLVAHFLNLNTPCCARKFNPANVVIPTIETEG